MIKMKYHKMFLFVAALCLLSGQSTALVDPVSVGTFAAIAGFAGLGYNFEIQCKYFECCNSDYIPLDTEDLKKALQEKLYGQHVAKSVVYSSIKSHVEHENPRKPLVLSFHGYPGSGKNYISEMIAKALFKKGESSKYYKFYNGRNDFPNEAEVKTYQKRLQDEITTALNKCERTLFIFDEVDKIPAGLLDVLVPFLDYTSYKNRGKSKAIFIFLSNTGSAEIADKMLSWWKEGRKRNDIQLRDFEDLITIGAFNEAGGFYKSDTITSRLIDHHVPFLPMERAQIASCVMDIYAHFGIINPPEADIKEVLSNIRFGPPGYDLYCVSGCKRLEHKVTSLIYKDAFNENINRRLK